MLGRYSCVQDAEPDSNREKRGGKREGSREGQSQSYLYCCRSILLLHMRKRKEEERRRRMKKGRNERTIEECHNYTDPLIDTITKDWRHWVP